MNKVLYSGNPVEGFSVIGPFDSSEAAEEYASHLDDGDWWIAPLWPTDGDF